MLPMLHDLFCVTCSDWTYKWTLCVCLLHIKSCKMLLRTVGKKEKKSRGIKKEETLRERNGAAGN